MDFETIKTWLTKWVGRQIKKWRFLGILGLMLAPPALAFATTCVYWLLRLFTHDAAGNLGDSRKCLLISLAIIPCLFIGNLIARHRDLMEEQLSDGRDGFSVRREVVPLLFLWIMFTGPRLFNWAFHCLREAQRWQQTDIHSCAAVLWLLLSKPGKVSFDDMQHQLDWLNLGVVLPEVSRISGVVSLKTPPAGLSLTQDLREQIRSELAT